MNLLAGSNARGGGGGGGGQGERHDLVSVGKGPKGMRARGFRAGYLGWKV